MASTDIKATMRALYREKTYALINLSGLSLAIACCLILGLYLRNELTYDRHHARHREIFRVVSEYTTSGSSIMAAVTSAPLGPMLKANYPEIRDYVRFGSAFRKVLIRSADKGLYWEDVYFTDENVFNVFTHKIIYGDPKTALKDPFSAAVSETFARRYFGDANPIGKTIQVEIARTDLAQAGPRKITLVFRDLPENTHLKYDVLLRLVDPVTTANVRTMLLGGTLYTYLVMPERYDISHYKEINDSFYARYVEDIARLANIRWKTWLQPLADIHLHSDLAYDRPTGNRYYIYGFSAVALFILLVACINYVNLATARAAKRAKEVGMRKILGASRTQLMVRFLSESMIFSLIALVVGLILVEGLLKYAPINELLGKPLEFGLRNEPVLLLWLLGLSLFIGFLSGTYPAIYLSSMLPVSGLVSTYGAGTGNARLRELLVFAQFTVSIAVIVSTLMMAQQLRYLSNKPLGFEKKNRIIVNLRGLAVIQKYPVIKNELSKISGIEGVTACSRMISTGQALAGVGAMLDNESGVPERVLVTAIDVADDFMDVMGMQLASGRDFRKRMLTDVGASFIVNETLVKSRGWKEPLGKKVQAGLAAGKVIGVVKDFHYESLHHAVEPLVISQMTDNFEIVPPQAREALQRTLVLDLTGSQIQRTLSLLQRKFAEYDPQHPFEFEFLDESIDRLYMSENRLMKMTCIFSGICIFISCLGLFGLAAFSTEQRSKEIGIRKVLGASSSQIIFMLSKRSLLLVLAGAVIASAAAYYAINRWMAGFAYRVGISPMIFVTATVFVIAIAFLTVAMQSYKSARANPALTLRYE